MTLEEKYLKAFSHQKVIDSKETSYRSHGTFTSNHTSWGVYGLEIKNSGFSEQEFMSTIDTIQNIDLNISKPKGCLYSIIDGAKCSDIVSQVKAKNFKLLKTKIKIYGLPYKDTFIGD